MFYLEVCAALYEHQNYTGWMYKVSEVDSENILSKYDNAASSIRIRQGCTFHGYKHANKTAFMFNSKEDIEDLAKYDEEISSYFCECPPSKIFTQSLISTMITNYSWIQNS